MKSQAIPRKVRRFYWSSGDIIVNKPSEEKTGIDYKATKGLLKSLIPLDPKTTKQVCKQH